MTAEEAKALVLAAYPRAAAAQNDNYPRDWIILASNKSFGDVAIGAWSWSESAAWLSAAKRLEAERA